MSQASVKRPKDLLSFRVQLAYRFRRACEKKKLSSHSALRPAGGSGRRLPGFDDVGRGSALPAAGAGGGAYLE